MGAKSNRFLLLLLASSFAVSVTTAIRTYVFRGTLVHSRVRTEMEILPDHLLGIDSNDNGRILFVRPASELSMLAQQFSFNPDEVTTLTNSQFLMPGFVDTHIHPASFRGTGLGYDRPLFNWIRTFFIDPEIAFRNATFARQLSMEFVRHTLREGTTTVVIYGSLGVESDVQLAEVVGEMGQRAIIGRLVGDVLPPLPIFPPELLPETIPEAEENTQRFFNLIRGMQNPLIRPSLHPLTEGSISQGMVEAMGRLVANQSDILVQAHYAESAPARNTILQQWVEAGLVPINRTLMAHSLRITDRELEVFQQRGVSIAHCPNANLNFRNGILDVQRMFNLGIKVGLGTDIAAGYSTSILNAMRVALHVSQALSLNLTRDLPAGYKALTLAEGFYLATMGGAEASALGDTIGNFEVGKQFDALQIDVNAPDPINPVFETYETDTINDTIEKFLYRGDERNIVNVYVAGRRRSSREALSGDQLEISFVNNSPRIVGTSVFVDISVSETTQSLTCHLRGVSGASREFSNEQDCSSLNTTYSNLNAGKYVLRVVGNAATGERAVLRREFRIGGSGDCTVNLINRGIVVRGNVASIEFAGNGDATSLICRIDRQQGSQCESPVTSSGLSSGQHIFQVSPQGCVDGTSYRLGAKFTVA